MAEINTSLMKKTKAQLVEIILRKDEVERECRTEISNLNKKIKDYNAEIEIITERSKTYKSIIDKQASTLIKKESLIEGMKSQFDISATEVVKAREAAYTYKRYVKVLSIVCVTLAITLICKLFVF